MIADLSLSFQRTLRALLENIAQHGVDTTVNFTSLLPARGRVEKLAKEQFVDRAGKWIETYMPGVVTDVFTAKGGQEHLSRRN